MKTEGQAQVSILLDTVAYTSKPPKREVGKIIRRLEKHELKLTLTEIKEAILNGQSFCPSTFGGGAKNNENWQQQQLFCLDFDSGFTPEEFTQRLTESELSCNMIITTFSDKPEHRKFRAFFLLEEPLTDKDERDHLQLSLMRLFPEADKSCKDAARFFFGGKEVIHFNLESRLDTELVKQLGILSELSQKNSDSAKSRFLSKECKENAPFLYNNKEGYGKLAKLRKYDWESAMKSCRILREFLEGNTKILHPQLFGLATNMNSIEGGAELFQEIILNNPNYSKDKQELLRYARKMRYLPMRLNNFSPYQEDHIFRNLRDIPLPKGKVRKLYDYTQNRRKLKEVEQEFLSVFNNIMENPDKKIHIFKIPPGFGKTQALIALKEKVIAIPDHSLKQEISNRMTTSHICTPSIPEGLSEPVEKKLKSLYRGGLYKEATSYMKKVIAGEDGNEIDQVLIEEYYQESLQAYQSNLTLLTTHQKALLIHLPHDTIIFDEDPLQKILPIEALNIGDLETLAFYLRSTGKMEEANQVYTLIDSFRTQLLNCPTSVDGFYFKDFNLIRDTVLEHYDKFQSNLLSFFHADYQIKDSENINLISFIRKLDLPSEKQIVILSATVNEEIYRTLYGDRVVFHDFSDIEYTGEIQQYPSKGFSKTYLGTKEGKADAIRVAGDAKVITFMTKTHLFPNAEKGIYFWKITGFDGLKGEDITIIGTPHLPQSNYALYSAILGYKLKPVDYSDFEYQKVNWNGYEFWFSTFHNPIMQKLQFHFIEEQLVQAVGRSRPLREDCIVKLFSNYPLKEAYLAS